jgi:hypothetical protein
MTELDKTVAELRAKLARAGSRFLLVYTDKNHLKQTIDTRVTSNSSPEGVRAILTYIIRPTQEATALLAKTLIDVAKASAGVTPESIDKAVAELAFSEAAKVVFEKLRPLLTIVGWENEKPQPS